MPIHTDPSYLAGRTVRIRRHVPNLGGMEFRVEDWWDRVAGQSWRDSSKNGNPAAVHYQTRPGCSPCNDEVLYGKIGSTGHLVHVCEIDATSLDS